MPSDDWHGRGSPPSREAAIKWAIRHGARRSEAEAAIGSKGRTAMGADARALVEQIRLEYISGTRAWAKSGETEDKSLFNQAARIGLPIPGGYREPSPVRYAVPQRVRLAQFEDELAEGPPKASEQRAASIRAASAPSTRSAGGKNMSPRRNKWNGLGRPPSREAAIEFVMERADVSRAQAKKVVGAKGTLTAVGVRVREAVGIDERVGTPEHHRPQTGAGQYDHPIGPGPEGPMGAKVPVKKSLPQAGPDVAPQDLDRDGIITAEEIAAQAGGGGIDADAIDLGFPTGAGPGSRGAALLPAPTTPEQAAELEVENRSTITRPQRFDRDSTGTMEAPAGGKVGVRYFEDDLVEPLRWSAERRADLQRVMQSIGLYGDKKIQLGSWSAVDTQMWAALLEYSNVNGLMWHEQLAAWRRNPPADLLETAAGPKRAPLVIRQTNPVDIAQTAEEVSRGLIGRVDRDFAEGTVGGYQAAEAQAQTSAYNADEQGGTVTDAPTVQGFAVDQLREDNPVEVDSYATLGAFNEMLRVLGLAG